MKECPVCNAIRPYKLSDGRFKCRVCGTRFSWTSAWDSVRLEAATKQRLTEMFVLGVPIYRLRHRKDASAPTKERYYRILRACCALAENWSVPFQASAAGHIMFRITESADRVSIAPVRIDAEPQAAGFIGRPQRIGRPWFVDGHQALLMLPLKGDHVLIAETGEAAPAHWSNPAITAFWNQAKKGMEPQRGVRLRYFHLHLGEACYRYNHRGTDLKPLLLGLMRAYAIREVNSAMADARPPPRPRLPLQSEPPAEESPEPEVLPQSQTVLWAGAPLTLGNSHAAD